MGNIINKKKKSNFQCTLFYDFYTVHLYSYKTINKFGKKYIYFRLPEHIRKRKMLGFKNQNTLDITFLYNTNRLYEDSFKNLKLNNSNYVPNKINNKLYYDLNVISKNYNNIIIRKDHKYNQFTIIHVVDVDVFSRLSDNNLSIN